MTSSCRPAATKGSDLTEDEAVLLPHHAAYATRPTRHAAAAALALAAGHSGEIDHSVVADLYLTHSRVWVHGARKYDPRWCRLDARSNAQQAARIA